MRAKEPWLLSAEGIKRIVSPDDDPYDLKNSSYYRKKEHWKRWRMKAFFTTTTHFMDVLSPRFGLDAPQFLDSNGNPVGVSLMIREPSSLQQVNASGASRDDPIYRWGNYHAFDGYSLAPLSAFSGLSNHNYFGEDGIDLYDDAVEKERSIGDAAEFTAL